MKTLEDLRREQRTTDLQEVVRNVEDDIREAAKKGKGSMYEFTKKVVDRYYPQNPFDSIGLGDILPK